MKPEKQSLLHDLLENEQTDTRRQTIFFVGSRILRRRRQWRFARRCFSVIAVVAVMVLGVQKIKERKTEPPRLNPAVSSASLPAAPAAPQVHYLSDSELLELFPGTPVALATIDGKKRLLFPRPGDQARFVSRPPPPLH